MNIELLIYLMGLVIKLSALLSCLVIVVLGGLLVHTIFRAIEYNGTGMFPSAKRWVIGGWFAMLAVLTILPSERTMYMMAGAYFGKEVLNSDVAQKVKSLIEYKLDDIIAEQTTKVKDKVTK